jgi:hypothetical protein
VSFRDLILAELHHIDLCRDKASLQAAVRDKRIDFGAEGSTCEARQGALIDQLFKGLAPGS